MIDDSPSIIRKTEEVRQTIRYSRNKAIMDLVLVELLMELGLAKDQTIQFALRLPVVYALRTQSHPGIALIHWTDNGLLRSGIIEVDDRGNGSKTFRQFRDRTLNIGKYLKMQEYELFGAAIINGDIEKMVKRLDFAQRLEPVPDDLGNDGEMEVYFKLFLIR